jgi:hypothetical protein
MFGGHVVPGALHLLLRADVEVDLVEDRFEVREVAAPGRHRLGVVDLQRLEPEIEHPLRLVLLGRDLAHHLLVQPRPDRKTGSSSVMKWYLYSSSPRSFDDFVLWHGQLLGWGSRRPRLMVRGRGGLRSERSAGRRLVLLVSLGLQLLGHLGSAGADDLPAIITCT